ncbi:MAG: alpha amylase C-terminal domain-containing protein, partial [Nostoc sp.]
MQSDNIQFFYENAEDKVLAYTRWDGQNSHIVVVANFSGENLNEYKIPNFPSAQDWQDCLTNWEVKVGEDGLVTDLPSYTAKVFG